MVGRALIIEECVVHLMISLFNATCCQLHHGNTAASPYLQPEHASLSQAPTVNFMITQSLTMFQFMNLSDHDMNLVLLKSLVEIQKPSFLIHFTYFYLLVE